VNAFLWVILAGAAILVAGYLLAMRVLYRQSKNADQQVDLTKLKPWVDDDRKN